MAMETSKENVEFCWTRWQEYINNLPADAENNYKLAANVDLIALVKDLYESLQKDWDLDRAARFINACENILFPQLGIPCSKSRLPHYSEFIKISPKLFAELSSPDVIAINDTDINNVLVNYGEVIRGALLKPITETCRTFAAWGDDFNQPTTFTMYLDISKLTILEAKRLEETFSDRDAVKKILDEILTATFFGDIAKQWETHLELTDISRIDTTHEAGLPYLKVEIKGNLFYSYGFIKKYLELAEDNSEQVTKNPR